MTSRISAVRPESPNAVAIHHAEGGSGPALARGASVYLAGDTGPAHIAAAVGTPVVGIYGPTRPSRNGPWAPADLVVSRSDVCQCHHLRQCRLQTKCLDDISVDQVLEAVERRLGVRVA